MKVINSKKGKSSFTISSDEMILDFLENIRVSCEVPKDKIYVISEPIVIKGKGKIK